MPMLLLSCTWLPVIDQPSTLPLTTTASLAPSDRWSTSLPTMRRSLIDLDGEFPYAAIPWALESKLPRVPS